MAITHFNTMGNAYFINKVLDICIFIIDLTINMNKITNLKFSFIHAKCEPHYWVFDIKTWFEFNQTYNDEKMVFFKHKLLEVLKISMDDIKITMCDTYVTFNCLQFILQIINKM